MRCCVRGCTNRTEKIKKASHRVTFHLFPRDPNQRAAWIEAVGLKDWKPTVRTVICSDHFKEDNFYDTKKGLRRINNGAVPFMDEGPADDAPAVTRVCKICLCLDSKMYPMKSKKLKLDKMYESLIPLPVTEGHLPEKLPNQVCWECAARLKSAVCFQAKALLADKLLQDILKTEPFLKLRDIKTIHCKHISLKSTLRAQKLFANTELEKHENRQSLVKTEDVEVINDEVEIDIKDLVNDIDIKDEQNQSTEEFELYADDIRKQDEIACAQVEDTTKDIFDDVNCGADELTNEDFEAKRETFKLKLRNIIDVKDLAIDIGIKDEQNQPTEEFELYGDGIKKEDRMACAQVEDTTKDILDDFNCADDAVANEDFEATNDDNRIVEICVEDDKSTASKMTELIVFDDKVNRSIDGVEKKVVIDAVAKNAENNPGPTRKRAKKKPYVKPKLPIDENVISILPLTKEQLIQEVEERKESTRYKDAPYKCTVCYKWFSTKDKLIRHALKHSEKNGAYQCEICKIRLKLNGLLTAHMNTTHANEYTCRLCPYVTRSRHTAQQHVRFHGGKKFKCPQCALEFEKQTTLLNHLRLKHLSDAVCELCGYTFVSKSGVNTHRKIKHPLISKDIKLEGPYCELCDVTFLSQKVYERHLGLSSKHIRSFDDPNRLNNDPSIKSRKLSKANMSKIARSAANDPLGNKTNCLRDLIDCEQCGVELPNQRAYANHFKTTHPGINRTKFPIMKRTCICEHCGKIFPSNTLLNNHQWVHTGQKRFQCDHCNKTFAQKAVLLSHIMTHGTAPRRYYDCRICGKRFCSPSGRMRHTYLHMSLKPFKCEICEKNFLSSHELRAHVDHVHNNKPRPKRVWKKRTRNYEGNR